MNSNRFREFLLSHIPNAKPASGGSLVNCRCMYCGDSKNIRSKHFYISIPQDDTTPSLFYCHLCHASGVTSYKRLLEWNIYDDEVAVDLINHNRSCSKTLSNRKYFDHTHYHLLPYSSRIDPLTTIKLEHLNNRLGTSFTVEELSKLKIVLNLNDVLQANYITNLTRSPSIVDQLDKNFLGFISIDNAFVNMRRLCDKGKVYKTIDKRYINYKLVDKFDTSERFYTIPTTIDLSQREPVKVHIAEGPFDILSVYKNVRHEEPGIYTSIGGSNYKGIIMYMIETYWLVNAEVHYYPDNDYHGSNWFMKDITKYLKPTRFPMYVHRNTYPDQKDFGVHYSLINESIVRVI